MIIDQSTLCNEKNRYHFIAKKKKKNREIFSLVTSFVKLLLSRNFCQKSVRQNYFCAVLAIFNKNSVKSTFLLTKLITRNIFSPLCVFIVEHCKEFRKINFSILELH